MSGIIVALIATCLGAAFVRLVKGLPAGPTYLLAILIGLFVGLLIGPLAYHLPNFAIALIACGFLGALIGWLICRLMCPPRRGPTLEKAYER